MIRTDSDPYFELQRPSVAHIHRDSRPSDAFQRSPLSRIPYIAFTDHRQTDESMDQGDAGEEDEDATHHIVRDGQALEMRFVFVHTPSTVMASISDWSTSATALASPPSAPGFSTTLIRTSIRLKGSGR